MPGVIADLQDNGCCYLDDELTQECIVDVDLSELVFRPVGVEYNEWLATHSELLVDLSLTVHRPIIILALVADFMKT